MNFLKRKVAGIAQRGKGALAALLRFLVVRPAAATINLVVRLLAVPVLFVSEQALWIYFGVCGSAVGVAVYQLTTLPATASVQVYLWLLAAGAAAAVAGMLYHLVRHRFAELLALVACAPALAAGIYLVTFTSPTVENYNQVLELKRTKAGSEDLAGQLKLLDASLAAYEQDQQRGRLYRLVFGDPQVDIAARANFHKAICFVKLPNKGKEAFTEVSQSLMKNPGHFFWSLTQVESAQWKNDSDQARRLLEKLIRSGQDGGQGRPNQPGQQGQGPPSDKRDPGKQPAPGAGRQPTTVL